MSVRVEHAVTSGTFSLDGGTWEVDNNVWLLGDEHECVVFDAPHDDVAIAELIDARRVVAILLTHAHDDHIRAARELSERVGAPIWLHPDDRVLWDLVYDDGPDAEVADGQLIDVAGVQVQVLHTPGHSPGAVCYHVPALGVLFSGDTLFQGGPGATGRSYSSFETIIESIRTKLFALADETVVHTGHGDDTTIGAERPHLEEWIARGH
ncbi:MBL fold metallo-hydrolase [Aestuariimicrobium ganziense]|uniref:MBL fold metallo-hydrolase n=1 Tax=Aestuariimicrobium ganziense TaxID=2773677 RepID=UPI0019421246|nr:MBL fold metallo-hydrolase [Aestuariimicrobium ganziense]